MRVSLAHPPVSLAQRARARKRMMQAMDLTVSVDQTPSSSTGNAIVNGQDAGPGVTISGDKPPSALKAWQWWALAALALGGIWWLVKDDVEKEGAHVQRPFAG